MDREFPGRDEKTGRKAPSKGVLLLNYGGPRSDDEVLPFLEELFSDPAIFRYPSWLRKRVARFAARRRAPKLSSAYREMGRFSPIWDETEAQASALREELGEGFGVFTAMRYFPREMDLTAREIRDSGVGELLLLPLYPQESDTTTVSAITAARKSLGRAGFRGAMLEARSFFREKGFIGAVSRLLREKIDSAEEKPRIIFAAHGLPVKLALKDNYQDQVRETAKLISSELSLILTLTNPSANSWQEAILAFQGKVGVMKWLKPSVEDVIEEWSAAGCRSVLLVPISFVSEHSETLHEIDIVYRELAESLGMRFSRVPTVGSHPLFIRCLADVTKRILCG